MPLPTPKKDETKSTFISRCIKDLNETEKDRFPADGQIEAICYAQWNKEHPEDKKKKEKASLSELIKNNSF